MKKFGTPKGDAPGIANEELPAGLLDDGLDLLFDFLELLLLVFCPGFEPLPPELEWGPGLFFEVEPPELWPEPPE